MESPIPQHVKITTDRPSNSVGVELDYGREASIRFIWTPEEAMAVAAALAEAAEVLRRTGEPFEDRTRVNS
jgi:hypothetical protein